MKKTTIAVIIIIVLVVVGIIVFGRGSTPSGTTPKTTDTGNGQTTTPPVASSEVTKVSSKVSSYQNDELGFSVKYPSAWEKNDNGTGVSFIMPVDQSQVSTINKLQADVSVATGKCAFPPVTTVKDRGTLTVGGSTLNMIAMTNTVTGTEYFNRMYSLQKDDVCYFFSFASIAKSPASKNLTGSNVTQAQNNNKAITATADAAFTDMVKSFAFVSGPAGKDETSVVPTKK